MQYIKGILLLLLIIFTTERALANNTVESFNNAIKRGDLAALKLFDEEFKKRSISNEKAINNAIHLAIQSGDLDVIRYLGSRNYPIDFKDEKGRTPLMVAVVNGQDDTASLLLELGANIESQDNNKLTPLCLAVLYKNVSSLELLLKAGANVNARGPSQFTPLMIATKYSKDLAIVNRLISASASLNAQNDNGWTALHMAADYPEKLGHDLDKVAQSLIQAGANIESKNIDKATPLAIAARNNKPKTLQVLLEAGARVDTRDKWQWTPLMRAVNDANNLSMVNKLIAKGANVDAQNEDGWTALHMTVNKAESAEQDLAKIAKSLIDAGANVDLENQDKSTPLLIAARNAKLKTLKVLIEEGANVNAQDKIGRTPLIWGANSQNISVVNFLITAKADVGIKDDQGFTALTSPLINSENSDHYLAELVSSLINAGVDVNEEYNTLTPLMNAAYYNRPQTAKLLIQHGADLTKMSSEGLSALDYARKQSSQDVIQLFASYADNIGTQVLNQKAWRQAVKAIKRGNVQQLKAVLSTTPEVMNYYSSDDLTLINYIVKQKQHSTDTKGLMLLALQFHGAAFNQNIANGMTPLQRHLKFYDDDNEMAAMTKLLIKFAPDTVNIKDESGLTPILGRIREKTAKALIEAGADVNVVSPTGWTPLMWHVQQGNSRVVELLLKHGAKVDAKDKEGNTILHFAAEIGLYNEDSFENGTRRSKMINMLLKHGATVNVKNNLGETPLMKMAYWSKLDGVRLLLKHGADAKDVDNSGSTALHHLAKTIGIMPEETYYISYPGENDGGNQYIVYFKAVANEMILRGANLGAKNSRGESAIDIASNHNNDVAEALKAAARG